MEENLTHPLIKTNGSINDATTNLQPYRLAIFASGAGSNAQRIINYFKSSSRIQVSLIACNKPEAGILQIAEKEHLPVLMIEKEIFFKGDGYVARLQEARIDFIILAGFLWRLPQTLIHAYPKKIINIHPALLPKYGGKGMYGHFVHEAVLAAHEPESGITIHYVDEHYDHGDTIFQARCPVEPTDDVHTLSKKVQVLEHHYYPKIIEEVIKKN